MANTSANQNYSFKCADAGHPNCDWETSGNNEQEVMSRVEQHGRDAHDMNIDENLRNKIRNVINRQAA